MGKQVSKRLGDHSKDRYEQSQKTWSQWKKIKHRKKRAYNKEKLMQVIQGRSEDESYSEIKKHNGWNVR